MPFPSRGTPSSRRTLGQPARLRTSRRESRLLRRTSTPRRSSQADPDMPTLEGTTLPDGSIEYRVSRAAPTEVDPAKHVTVRTSAAPERVEFVEKSVPVKEAYRDVNRNINSFRAVVDCLAGKVAWRANSSIASPRPSRLADLIRMRPAMLQPHRALCPPDKRAAPISMPRTRC